MSRHTGRKQAATDLALLLETVAHANGRTDVVATQELDELVTLASALRALQVERLRPEFRATLRARLLDEARALAAPARSDSQLESSSSIPRSSARAAPPLAFVRPARGVGSLLGPLGRLRVRLSLGSVMVRGPR